MAEVQVGGGTLITETDIMNQIRLALSAAGHMNFRGNVGKVKMADGRWFSTGLPEGFSDLFGFRKTDGRMFFIEVKTEKGKLRQDQVRFLNAMKERGAIVGVARSAEQALRIVEERE